MHVLVLCVYAHARLCEHTMYAVCVYRALRMRVCNRSRSTLIVYAELHIVYSCLVRFTVYTQLLALRLMRCYASVSKGITTFYTVYSCLCTIGCTQTLER